MSRLAAAVLRRSAAAQRVPSSPLGPFPPFAWPRSFSTDASGEAGAAGDGGLQSDSFFTSSGEGLIYGKFFSNTPGASRLSRQMLKTDIIHYYDQCGLSLDDVKMDYNRGYTPMGALLRFPSPASFNMALRQTNQLRMYKLERVSRSEWDLKLSYDGKAVLLQGVPFNALPEDIERFLSGANFEGVPFENSIRPGVPEPIRMVLVKFRTKHDAMNAFITKNRSFCLNNRISVRVLQ